MYQELKSHNHPIRFRLGQWAEDRQAEGEHFCFNEKLSFPTKRIFIAAATLTENPQVTTEKASSSSGRSFRIKKEFHGKKRLLLTPQNG